MIRQPPARFRHLALWAWADRHTARFGIMIHLAGEQQTIQRIILNTNQFRDSEDGS